MLLLDTCTFIWWLAKEDELPGTVLQRITKASEVNVSVISIWEILVKHSIGKLNINSGNLTAYDYLLEQIDVSDFRLVELISTDLRQATNLPLIHRDPFDRMLICQAIERDMVLVTPDPIIHRYPLSCLWQ